MANEIENFENSFIRFAVDEETCFDYNEVRLPIKNANDIACMVKMTATTEGYVTGLRFYIIRGSYTVGALVPAASIVMEVVTFGSSDLGGGEFLLYTHDDTCEADPLSGSKYPPTEGECLRLAILTLGYKEMVAIADQEFYYKSDTCFTNLVIYKCNDDSFGFLYETAGANFYNSIRLPIALINPRPATEKSGFRKSDGRFLTLSANKAKQWDCEIDVLTDHQHQCLDAAIDHDVFYISENLVDDCEYTEYYREPDDKYDIDWNDGEGTYDGIAKAKVVLHTNPYYSTNNNC